MGRESQPLDARSDEKGITAIGRCPYIILHLHDDSFGEQHFIGSLESLFQPFQLHDADDASA